MKSEQEQSKIVRARVIHSMSPTTAQYGGLSNEELRLFRSGNFQPNATQLRDLARWLGIEDQLQ